MALNAYLKIDGIKGEMLDGSVQLLSCEWGDGHQMAPPPPPRMSARRTGSSLVVTKMVDSASPGLFKATLDNTSLGGAVLTIVSPPASNTGKETYFKWHIRHVTVASVDYAGSAAGDEAPKETITFEYGGISL